MQKYRSPAQATCGLPLIVSLVFATITCLASADSITATASAAPPPAEAHYLAGCDELRRKSFALPEDKLDAIFAFDWRGQMEAFPERATYDGVPGWDDQLTNMSLQAIQAREQNANCLLGLIESVPLASLKKTSDQLNYELFYRALKEQIAGREFPSHLLAIDQMGGVHTSFIQLMQTMKHETTNDFQNILSRMEKAPLLIEQNQTLLAEGLRQQITPPQAILKPLPEQFRTILSADMKINPLYSVFLEMPASMPSKEKEKITSRARELILTQLIPHFRTLRDFLQNTYIPAARKTIAISDLKNGVRWYSYLVRAHTTTDKTPEEIHQIGLAETERIDREMVSIMKASGWKKSKAEYFNSLRHDTKYFYKKSEDLLSAYRGIAKTIDPQLSRLFGKLPRLTYGIKAVPHYSEPSAPTAYYEPGSGKAGRPGWFVANTYKLQTRPKWEMTALTCHESVPGHHLQLALADELEGLPEFRKNGFYSAFVEGWGLYAESLCDDLGLYQDQSAKMGQLTYEMWRALRLVVDTGIHAKNWSREQAVSFMLAHTPKTQHDIEVEVDRYIAWPGQATAYKIGQMKFSEMKSQARAKLGEHFDIRRFHDALLSDGALPLDTLEKKMQAWVRSEDPRVVVER
jgi:uncharacterized protein (DUF885 family)